MTSLTVVEDDCTKIPADALIAVIRADGRWQEYIHRAIRTAAGDQFHAQLPAAGNLVPGAVYPVTTSGPHSGQFTSVLFAIDDPTLSRGQALAEALKRAEAEELGSVIVPLTNQASLNSAVRALSHFLLPVTSSHVQDIKLAVLNDQQLAEEARTDADFLTAVIAP